MKNVDQIRRDKLAELINEFGSATNLANKLGRGVAQIYQWVKASPDSKTGKPRVIGNNSARYIEDALGKPSGWMDNQSTQLVTTTSDQPNLNPRETALLGLFNGLTKSQQEEFLRDVEAQKQTNDALLDELLKRRG